MNTYTQTSAGSLEAARKYCKEVHGNPCNLPIRLEFENEQELLKASFRHKSLTDIV